MLAIERRFGRVRVDGERWGPRTLDLDLLLHGEARLDVPGLQLAAVISGHPAGAEQLPTTALYAELHLRELALVTGMDARDMRLPRLDQLTPVQRRLQRHLQPQRAGTRQMAGQLRRFPHDLLGHAAQVDAGATDRGRFQDRHPGAMAGGADGGNRRFTVDVGGEQKTAAGADDRGEIGSLPLPVVQVLVKAAMAPCVAGYARGVACLGDGEQDDVVVAV